jgi:uroporphyrinogen-III synthase
VNEVPVYRNVPDSGELAVLRAELDGGGIDAVAFASSSSVQNLMALVPATAFGATPAVCIGPSTAAAARDAGLARVVQAADASIDGLVAAIRLCLEVQRHD